jgi:Thioredoxin
MKLTLDAVTSKWGYHAYVAHVDDLVAHDQTTGTNHSPDYVDFTRMGQQRTHRIYKTTAITPALEAATKQLQRNYHFVVIVEAWCGDVCQNLPVIQKVAELNPNISLEVILRDENPDIMDHFTTDGGRAVPILVVIDADTHEVITRWGPRPAPAQKMVKDYKALTEKVPYMEFVKELQLWYAHDHTQTLQAELLKLVSGLEA